LQQSKLRNVLIRAAQSAAQHLHELGPDLRVTIEQREHISLFEDRQVAGSYRPGVGGSFLAVEQRDLAEKLSRLHNRKHDLLASRRRHADAHAAAENRH
jgi:hypothetical protein